jgi:DNA-binding NtrC family response regulator
MPTPTDNPMPTRTLRVLVVEDEPRLRELLLDVLPGMGYPASAARSGEEALRVMQSDPHDLIILDLQLPGMGGMECFERIRHHWPASQVIVLTGFGDLEMARQAIHLDVVDFLSKPSHLKDIEQALERARRRLHAGEREAGGRKDTIVEVPASSASPANPEAVTLWETERQQILAALKRTAGNRTAAAQELGISRRTLHYRLREYRRLGYSIE